MSEKLTFIGYDTDADVWVGSCPELGLVSQGKDADEAERAIHGAINLFVITCYALDILRATMKRLKAASQEPPREGYHEKSLRLSIPLAS